MAILSGQNYIEQQGLVTKVDRDDLLAKSDLGTTQHVGWASRYSGGFSLLDTFKIPRPCAFKSYNMTEAQYYRGQNEYTYPINQAENTYVTSLMENPTLYLINGTEPQIAKYDKKSNSIIIQTDSEDDVHMHQVLLRDCNDFSRLLELNLYIKVLSNTYPAPVVDIQTTFNLDVGDTLTYTIPRLVDPEGNDNPEAYVGKMVGQEDKYPPFLLYENAT